MPWRCCPWLPPNQNRCPWKRAIPSAPSLRCVLRPRRRSQVTQARRQPRPHLDRAAGVLALPYRRPAPVPGPSASAAPPTSKAAPIWSRCASGCSNGASPATTRSRAAASLSVASAALSSLSLCFTASIWSEPKSGAPPARCPSRCCRRRRPPSRRAPAHRPPRPCRHRPRARALLAQSRPRSTSYM